MSKKNIKKTLLSSTAMMMALTTAIPSTVVPSNAYHNIDSISERTLEKAIETAKLERAEITNITAKSNVESLENLVDGNTDTFVDSQYWNWESTATSPQVLTFELTETVKLNKVRLHPRKNSTNGRMNSYVISVSVDGTNYTDVKTGTIDPNLADWTDVTFEATDAKYVKISLTSSNFDSTHVITCAEVELYKEVTTGNETSKEDLVAKIAEAEAITDKTLYSSKGWSTLQTALTSAKTVNENPEATAEEITKACEDLAAALTKLEDYKLVAMTNFVSYENGKVTVELNTEPGKIPDGSTIWTYEFKDGKHLLSTENWDDNLLADGETVEYRKVMISNKAEDAKVLNFVYIPKVGEAKVITALNAEKPTVTTTVDGVTYDLRVAADKTAFGQLKLTEAPVIRIEGIDLHGVTKQLTGVGQGAVSVTVSGDHTVVEFPLVDAKDKFVSGNYTITGKYTKNSAETSLGYISGLAVNVVKVDKSKLQEAIDTANGLIEEEYTEDSWNTLQEALEKANLVNGKNAVTQAEIDTATTTLTDAITALEEASKIDKAALQELIARAEAITDKTLYSSKGWNTLQTALTNAKTVNENEAATDEEIAQAYETLSTALDQLEDYRLVAMTNFVSYENGRVTVELNTEPGKIPDGSTIWTYEFKDGKHLLSTEDWDGASLAADETNEYRRIYIYNKAEDASVLNFVYIPEVGEAKVLTALNAEKPRVTTTIDGVTYDLTVAADKTALGKLKLTEAPVVRIEGIDLHGVTKQLTGAGQGTVAVEVTGDHTVVEFPLVDAKDKFVSGRYSINGKYAKNSSEMTLMVYSVQIATVKVDKSKLQEAIDTANGLTEEEYTEDSWNTLQEALEEANQVNGKNAVTQAEIDDATKKLNDAIAGLVEINKVDKSALQALYDECSAYEIKYITDDGGLDIKNRFHQETAVAKVVLDNEDATQEEVDAQYNVLENRYWCVKLQEHVWHYSPKRGNFDYNEYLTDSIIPLYVAYKEGANKFSTYVPTDTFKELHANFETAIENIVKVTPEQTGIAYGLNGQEESTYSRSKQGKFTISETIVKDETTGKETLQLNITFENTGINPMTGKQASEFTSSDLRKASFDLDYETVDGSGSFGIDPTEITTSPDGNKLYKFTVNMNEEMGDDGNYAGDYYVRMTSGSNKIASLGNFRASTYINFVADKTALQELYDETKDYLPTYLPHDWHIADFNDALAKALAALEKVDATQEEVDEAYTLLNARYWSVRIQDLQYKFDPAKKNFDYRPYTTESNVPLVQHFILTNDLWFGGKTDTYTAQYKAACEKYAELESKLDLVNDRTGLGIGFNKDAALISSKQGHFTVSESRVVVDGYEKVKLHIEFFNDGIHAVSGKEKQMFTASDMAKGRMTYTQYDYSGKYIRSNGLSASKLLPLDGETDKTKGFQVDLILEHGEYALEFEAAYSDVSYPGYFRTSKDTTAPTATVEYSTTELTNGNVLVTITTSEAVEAIEGWTKVSDTVFTKEFTANATATVKFVDLAGNEGSVEVSVTNIDKVAPTATVEYSTTELTNGNVLVTITTSEAVEVIEGWTKVSDTVFTKEFTTNATETVKFVDLAGNEGSVEVSVTNIDTTAPTAEVIYEEKDGKVVVTIKTSEPVKDIEGWNKVSDTEFTKEFTENGTETVTFEDFAGNTGSVEIKVDQIKSDNGTDTDTPDTRDNTHVAAYTFVMAVLGSVLAFLAGKKRREE